MNRWRTLLGVATLMAMPVWAQGGAQPAQAAPPPSESAEPSRRDPDTLSDAEKLRISTNAISRMRTSLRDVLGSLEEARRSRDVVKLNCVNEKLTQMKGLLRISEQADVALQEAVATKNEVGVRHEFTKVDIANDRVDSLSRESSQCIGELAFRTDENLTVSVEEPEDYFGSDPTRPEAQPPVTVRPPPASPSL